MNAIETLSDRINALKTEAIAVDEGWALMVVVCGDEKDRLELFMAESRFDDMRVLGRMYCKRDRKAELLMLASKIWVGASQDLEPCEDPERKEAVLIAALGQDGDGQSAIKIEDGDWLESPTSRATAPLLAAFWEGHEGKLPKKERQEWSVLRTRWLTPPPFATNSLEDLNKANLSDTDLASMLRGMHPREWLCASVKKRRRMIQDFRRMMQEEHRWN